MSEEKIHPNDVLIKLKFSKGNVNDCQMNSHYFVASIGFHSFWTAAVKNDEEGTVYVRNAAAPASRNIHLIDDQISKHLGVCAGFNLTHESTDIDFGLEDEEGFQNI